MIIIMKFICLFIAVLFSIINVVRCIARNYLSPVNFILQAMGIAGFITLQFLIK